MRRLGSTRRRKDMVKGTIVKGEEWKEKKSRG
jgi:hypothetical protein